MHRIDADGHNSNQFTGGDPSNGVPATQIDAPILNAFQEEIANTVEGHGVALVKGTNTQLRDVMFRHVVGAPGGRLAASSTLPVTVADVLGVSSIYYHPYKHDVIELYDGSRWVPRTFSAVSQTATDTTKSPAACVINSNYDIFGWDDAGTFRISRGPAWSTDTSRGTGAGTTELELFEGRYVNKVAVTNGPAARRGVYLGTIRTGSSSALFYDAARLRFVWNMHNRVMRQLRRSESTLSWTYTLATDRAANASATNRVEVVRGLDEDTLAAHLFACASSSAAGTTVLASFGLDSSSARATEGNFASAQTPVANYRTPLVARYSGLPGIGFHYLQWLEYSAASGTTTWFGLANESGISGETLA